MKISRISALVLGGMGLTVLANQSRALTVTAVTSDNGYPAHLIQWTDADG